jgi:hypothetical protein
MIVVHEGSEPDALVDLFDSDLLAGEDLAEIAAAVPVVCRSGARRRQAGGSRSDVVVSGVVDSE